jgi:hypothetical protein
LDPGWPDEFVKQSPKMLPNQLFVKFSAELVQFALPQ